MPNLLYYANSNNAYDNKKNTENTHINMRENKSFEALNTNIEHDIK